MKRWEWRLVCVYVVAIFALWASIPHADVVIDSDAIRISGTANGCLFNDGNSIGTDAGCTYDPDTDSLTVTGSLNAGSYGAVWDDPNNKISGYLNKTGDPSCANTCDDPNELCLVDANTPYGRGPVVCRAGSTVGYVMFPDKLRGFNFTGSWSPSGGAADCSGAYGIQTWSDPNHVHGWTFLHPFTTNCSNGNSVTVGPDSDMWYDDDALRGRNYTERLKDVVNANWMIGTGDRKSQIDSVGEGVCDTRMNIPMCDGNPDTASSDPNVDPDYAMLRGITLLDCNSNQHIDFDDTDPNDMPTVECEANVAQSLDPNALDSFAEIDSLGCDPNQIIQRNSGGIIWECADLPAAGTAVGQFSHILVDPNATFDVLIGRAPAAITLTSWDCVARGGSITSATLTVRECDGDGTSCVGSGGSVMVTALDTNYHDGSFTDAAIDPNDWIEVLIPALTGSPQFIQCTLAYTVD